MSAFRGKPDIAARPGRRHRHDRLACAGQRLQT